MKAKGTSQDVPLAFALIESKERNSGWCGNTPTATVRNMAITLTPVASTDKIHISGEVRPLSAPVILFTGDVAHLSLCLDTTRYFESGKLRLSGSLCLA